MINDYIADICDILNINVPSVSFDTSNFSSKTMMAYYSSVSNTIYIRKKDKPDPDCFFAIAHELRHVWQLQDNESYYFSTYQTVDMIGLEKYNNQVAEVDAHAFASIVMREIFHLQPLYHGLSAHTIELIKQRIDEIISTFQ